MVERRYTDELREEASEIWEAIYAHARALIPKEVKPGEYVSFSAVGSDTDTLVINCKPGGEHCVRPVSKRIEVNDARAQSCATLCSLSSSLQCICNASRYSSRSSSLSSRTVPLSRKLCTRVSRSKHLLARAWSRNYPVQS